MPAVKKIVTTNRKAKHLYHILETIEAGIALSGTEVKSLRVGQGSIVDSYAHVEKGEMLLLNFSIPHYIKGNRYNTEPLRPKKLLLNKKEINRLAGLVTQKGFTLIPLSIYFNEKGWAKVELALCKGKKAFDKRETIRKRDERRIQEREMKYKQK